MLSRINVLLKNYQDYDECPKEMCRGNYRNYNVGDGDDGSSFFVWVEYSIPQAATAIAIEERHTIMNIKLIVR